MLAWYGSCLGHALVHAPCTKVLVCAKFLATGDWDELKCPYIAAILWRQIFD